MSHYFICSQNKDSKNHRFFQPMVPDFVAADFFPKIPSSEPARIPPQTPPVGGKQPRQGEPIPPDILFRPAESASVLFEIGSRGAVNSEQVTFGAPERI